MSSFEKLAVGKTQFEGPRALGTLTEDQCAVTTSTFTLFCYCIL